MIMRGGNVIMNGASISVVVPNYNNEKFLKECIESIVRQKYPIEEIIIVDDCSADDSVNLVREFQNKVRCPEIKLISLDRNQGVSHARNVGLEAARGEYITFLDADDCCFDEYKIANEMELICRYRENGQDIAAYSRVIHIDETGDVIKSKEARRAYNGNLFIRLLRTYDTKIIPRDYCIRTELIRKAGGYREDMSLYEDYELTLRLSKKTEFYDTNKNGTAYRIKENGLSDRSVRESDKVFFGIFREYAADLPTIRRISCYMYKRVSWIKRRTKTAVYQRLVKRENRNAEISN